MSNEEAPNGQPAQEEEEQQPQEAQYIHANAAPVDGPPVVEPLPQDVPIAPQQQQQQQQQQQPALVPDDVTQEQEQHQYAPPMPPAFPPPQLGVPPYPPPSYYLPPVVPPPPPHSQMAMHNMSAMAQFYEARMRDHAAAYASAAAGAAHAWAAAAQIASAGTSNAALPPTLSPYALLPSAEPFSQQQPHQQEKEEDEPPLKKRNQKLFEHQHHHQQSNKKRSRRRPRDYSSSSDNAAKQIKGHKYHRAARDYSSSSDNNPRTSASSKKLREMNLVGKTGISALNEWTMKRKKEAPKFVLLEATKLFVFSVSIDDLEWSRGRGPTKGAAKQDAARKALMALHPTVVFDPDTGLVMEEDLPNSLAQRLAISTTANKKRKPEYYSYSTATSTTSEEEEAGGVSAFTTLLSAMWQIQEIPEPPSYTFYPNDDLHRPRSYRCAATLNLTKRSLVMTSRNTDGDNKSDNDDNASSKKVILEVEAIGPTKREARHIASAKLLAQLFPDCEGMVQVKVAAEAARERYAARKNAKRRAMRKTELEKTASSSSTHVAFARPTDPRLPQSVVRTIRCLLSQEEEQEQREDVEEVQHDELSVESLTSSLSLSETVTMDPCPNQDKPTIGNNKNTITTATTTTEDSNARACSRQLQLEELVEAALLTFNEYDEEGREKPNLDDVGRTVLRRAEAEDASFIYKLLWGRNNKYDGYEPWNNLLSPLRGMESNNAETADESGANRTAICSRFWGPLSVTLLLCRAIAPHDEPPLGCAVLTLGFSLSHGRLLRVAEIGSEHHLPQERFLECLEQFAGYMKCALERKPQPKFLQSADKQHVTSTAELGAVVESFLSRSQHLLRDESAPPAMLQAVKEEEPEVEEDKESISSKPKTATKDNKPSKRTRIG